MSVKRWLITGGNGLLGREIVHLASVMKPAPELFIAGRNSSCNFFLDLEQDEIKIPTRIDTVLHIAGEKRDEERMDSVNYLGTRKLVEVSIKAGVKRFIYISSIGVYGAAPHSGSVNESFQRLPRNKYEKSKNAAENFVVEYCKQAGIDAIVLQPTNVIGEEGSNGSYPLLTLIKMVALKKFVWFGKLPPWVNYISVQDVAAVTLIAAQTASSGTYIVNTPAPLREVVTWIADELNVRTPEIVLPLWFGRLAATAGSGLSQIFGPTIPFHRERFIELTNTTYYDPSLLLKELPFEYPRGVESLIRGLVKTYQHKGMV